MRKSFLFFLIILYYISVSINSVSFFSLTVKITLMRVPCLQTQIVCSGYSSSSFIYSYKYYFIRAMPVNLISMIICCKSDEPPDTGWFKVYLITLEVSGQDGELFTHICREKKYVFFPLCIYCALILLN